MLPGLSGFRVSGDFRGVSGDFGRFQGFRVSGVWGLKIWGLSGSGVFGVVGYKGSGKDLRSVFKVQRLRGCCFQRILPVLPTSDKLSKHPPIGKAELRSF